MNAKQNAEVGFADCVAVTNNHHNHNSLFNTWQYYLVLSSLGQLLILTLNAAKQVVLEMFVEKLKRKNIFQSSLLIINYI